MTATVKQGRAAVLTNAQAIVEETHDLDRLVDGLTVIRMSDVQVETVTWLEPGYIPYGKITLVEGDPDQGKSTLTCALTAAVTTGRSLLGGLSVAPADVVLLNFEDGLGDTQRPRLEAAGADLARVHAVQGVPMPREAFDRLIELPVDVPALFDLVRATNAKLLIIDPIMAGIPSQIDSYKDQSMRRILAPLAKFAAETGCAVVVLRHLTKSGGARAITSGGGSIGIIGAARSALVVHQDPDHPDDPTRKILAVVKSNLCARAPSLAFRLVPAPNGSVCVQFTGTSKHSANDLSALRNEASEGGADAEKEIDGWLRGALDAGAVDRKELFLAAREARFSESALERAARRMKVVRSASGFGKAKHSLWSMPTTAVGEVRHVDRAI